LVAGGLDYLRDCCRCRVQCLKSFDLLVEMSVQFTELADQPSQRKRFRDGFDEANDCIACDTFTFQLQLLNDSTTSERRLPFRKRFKSFQSKLLPGLGMSSSCGLSSANVISSLKNYGRFFPHDSDSGVDQMPCLISDQIMPTMKSSYNTYVPQQISKKIDCSRRASQNAPSHFNIISLIEHAMGPNDAVLFRMHMKLLRAACVANPDETELFTAYPAKPPKFIDPMFCDAILTGRYIVKTPVWAVQYCLSKIQGMGKTYSIEASNAMDLASSADGAFLICGFINPDCVYVNDAEVKANCPHDPTYNIQSMNSRKKRMPSVVLYFPSTGSYYSPLFVSDTSRLRSKGMWL